MNILHITLGLGRGGIERLICDLSKIQLAQGHHVRVLAVRGGGDLEQELFEMGVPVDSCGMRKDWGLRDKLLWILWLKKYLIKYKFDAVIEHVCLQGYVAWACASAGIPHMVSVLHSTYRRRIPILRRFQNRIFLNRYRCFVAVSDSVQKFESETYKVPADRIRVIPNGLVWNNFQIPKLSEPDREKLLGFPLKGEKIIGTIGNLREAKNHELLLNSWALLTSDRSIHAKLIIVGGGDLREKLENQKASLGLNESVFFLGMRTDVPLLLKCFDIFVMSSKWEGQGIVSLEAMAAGLPIVATNVSGLRDVVQDEVNGFLVAPDDPHGIAEKLKKLILNYELRKTMAEKGSSYVKERFSIAQCATEYEKTLFESTLSRKYIRK